MKNHLHISNNSEKESLQKKQKRANTSSEAANSTMTEQLVIPPARVWDKIERILDEQDNRMKNANNLIASSFSSNQKFYNKHSYQAAVISVGVIVVLLWLFF